MKLKLNPTYCITPVYTTEGKGRKKKNVLNSVSYKFSFNRGIIVNGVVTKKDIKKTLPLLGSMGINFYEALLNTIKYLLIFTNLSQYITFIIPHTNIQIKYYTNNLFIFNYLLIYKNYNFLFYIQQKV